MTVQKSQISRKKSFTVDSDLLRMVIVTVAIFVAMASLSNKFTRPSVVTSMGYQIPELGFYSLAMMMVMVTGGRDLSIAGIGNLAGILAAMVMHQGYEAASGYPGSACLL